MNQDEAFDILSLGQNVFLTGPAGSGKTYLINRFIRYSHEHAIGIAVTASTGIAATHIGGMTIHSWSGLWVREFLTDEDIDDIISREYIAKRFAKTSILIIDEISMLSGGFLANLDRLLKSAKFSPEPYGGMQIVLVGDFFQLPPVTRWLDTLEYAFEHPIWRESKLIPCVLTTQFRQNTEDDVLLSILKEIRSGAVSKKSTTLLDSRNIRVETDDHTELFTKNIAVDAYNKEKLDAIAGDIFLFDMHAKWSAPLVEALKKGCLAPESLILKIWARVMFVKNNFEAGYVNGSLGHIVGRKEWLPIVELESGHRIIIDYASWSVEEWGKIKAEIAQIPLRLAWAITVHKSQGMTLDSAVMDLSDSFVPGQGYVALSRVRSLGGLILRGYNRVALETDARVRDYDFLLREASLKAQFRISALSKSEKEERQRLAIERLWGVWEPIDLTVSEKKEKLPTHEETFQFLESGLSLEEIAMTRWLKVSTIFTHIEKLLEEGKSVDLERIRPLDEERLARIIEGFQVLSTDNLSPVIEHLSEKYDEVFSYDEVRLARLFR